MKIFNQILQVTLLLIPLVAAQSASAEVPPECEIWKVETTSKGLSALSRSNTPVCGADGLVVDRVDEGTSRREHYEYHSEILMTDGRVEREDWGPVEGGWCSPEIPEHANMCEWDYKVTVYCRKRSCLYYGGVSEAPSSKYLENRGITTCGPLQLAAQKSGTGEGDQFKIHSSSWYSKYYFQQCLTTQVPDEQSCIVRKTCSSISDETLCRHTVADNTYGFGEPDALRGGGCVWKAGKCGTAPVLTRGDPEMSYTGPVLSVSTNELVDGSILCSAQLKAARLDQFTSDGSTFGGYDTPDRSIYAPTLKCTDSIPAQVFVPPTIESKSFGSAPGNEQYYKKKVFTEAPQGGKVVQNAWEYSPAILAWQYSSLIPKAEVEKAILKNNGGGFQCTAAVGTLGASSSLRYSCDGGCPNRFISMLKGYQKDSTGYFYRIDSPNAMALVNDMCLFPQPWNSRLTEDVRTRASFQEIPPTDYDSPFILPKPPEADRPQEIFGEMLPPAKGIISCLENASDRTVIRGGFDVGAPESPTEFVGKAFPTPNERKLGIVEWAYTLNQIEDNRKIYKEEKEFAIKAMDRIVSDGSKLRRGEQLTTYTEGSFPSSELDVVPSAIDMASKILKAALHREAYEEIRLSLATNQNGNYDRARRFAFDGTVQLTSTELPTLQTTALLNIFQDLCSTLKPCNRYEDVYRNIREMIHINEWFIESTIDKFPYLVKAKSIDLFPVTATHFPTNYEIFLVIGADLFGKFGDLKNEKVKDLEALDLLEAYLKCPNKVIEEKIGDRFDDIVGKMRERDAKSLNDIKIALNKTIVQGSTEKDKETAKLKYKDAVEWERAYTMVRTRRDVQRQIHLSNEVRASLHEGIWMTVLSGGVSSAMTSIPHLLKMTKTYKTMKEAKDIAEVAAKGKELERLGKTLYLSLDTANFALAAQTIPIAIDSCSEGLYNVHDNERSAFLRYFKCASDAVMAVVTSASFGVSSLRALNGSKRILTEIEEQALQLKKASGETLRRYDRAKPTCNYDPDMSFLSESVYQEFADIGIKLDSYIASRAELFDWLKTEVRARLDRWGVAYKVKMVPNDAGNLIEQFEILPEGSHRLNKLANDFRSNYSKRFTFTDEDFEIAAYADGLGGGINDGKNGTMFPGFKCLLTGGGRNSTSSHEVVHAKLDSTKVGSPWLISAHAGEGGRLTSIPASGYTEYMSFSEIPSYAESLIEAKASMTLRWAVASRCSGFANSLPLKDLIKRDLKELHGLAIQLKHTSQQTRQLAREAKTWLATEFSPGLHRHNISTGRDGVYFRISLASDKTITARLPEEKFINLAQQIEEGQQGCGPAFQEIKKEVEDRLAQAITRASRAESLAIEIETKLATKLEALPGAETAWLKKVFQKIDELKPSVSDLTPPTSF